MIPLLQAILLYFLLLLPGITFFHIWPLNSLFPDGGTLLFSSVLFALALLRAANLRELSFSVLALLPLGMLLPLLTSYLATETVLQTTLNWMIITLLLTASLVIVGEQLRSSGMDLQRVISKGLMVSGVLYTLFSLVQHYGLWAQLAGLPAPDIGRLKGAWQQPNLTTSTLWVTLFGVVYLNHNKKNLLATIVFSLIIGSALALAASRLNVLLVPYALAISIWLLWFSKTECSTQGRHLIAGTLVILVCLFVVPEISAPLEKKLVAEEWLDKGEAISLIDRRGSDSARVMEHLKIVGSMGGWSVNEWMFGKGVGQYGAFSYQEPVVPVKGAGGQAAWLHSHNLFSMIFVETGILGLVTLLSVVMILVRVVWRQRSTAWGVPALGGLGVIFTHSMVEYPLWYPWYLAVAILLAVPLFRTRRLSVTSPWLFSVAGIAVLIVVSGLVWNLGGQAKTILETAVGDDSSEESYRRLVLQANDGLLGPYAVLTKYRRFSPEKINLMWQLNEVRRISEWRPVDVVQLREVTLLLMMEDEEQACATAIEMVQRYPSAGPIILEKADRLTTVDTIEFARLAACVEEALLVWGETLESMGEKNRQRTNYELKVK